MTVKPGFRALEETRPERIKFERGKKIRRKVKAKRKKKKVRRQRRRRT